MWITKVSINQPVFATMVMLALMVLGIVSYQRLPVEQMPDVKAPNLSVDISYPGASPEAIENDVVKPIENVVNTVNGVHRIFSTMREGTANINIELRMDIDPTVVAQELRDKVAQIRPSLPRDMKEPQISNADSDENQQPIADLAVYSDKRSLREVSTLVDQIVVKRLENASGVGNVQSDGGVVRQIQIFLKPDQLRSYGIGVDQVVDAIQQANQDLPAGNIVAGASELLVRVEGRIKDPRQFGRIVVTTRSGPVYLQQGGVPIHLDDVADVVDGEAEETSISRVNGHPAVGVSIYKIQNANSVEVGEAIKKAITELKLRIPDDVHIQVLQMNSDDIKDSLEEVKSTIFQGGLLTILIVFLFLHSWRSTVITGLTLPISVFATFIALHVFGFTLNFISLMALSLCIGLLIDDAIVVRENITRHFQLGKPHKQAAEEGTNEIGLAVMATTFAILAVFVPVAFMNGFIGKIFYQFGITVSVAVLVSLFVSFTLDPMLSSVWPDPEEGRFKRLPWLRAGLDAVERRIESVHHVYGRVLQWSLGRQGFFSPRLKVLLFALLIFVGSFFLLPFIGGEFIPEHDRGFISLKLETPVGSSLEYMDAKTRQVEEALHAFPEIETISANVGNEGGHNTARVSLSLTDVKKTHRRSQQELEAAIRERLSSIAGVTLTVGFQSAIFISILGPDASKLTSISQDLIAEIAKVPGVVDLYSSERGSNPTLSVRVDQELAADLGLTNARIGQALRPLIQGDQISHWLGPDGQDYDVMVRLPKTDRRLASDLGDLYLSSNSRLNSEGLPLLVPLRQVAQFVETTSPVQLKRLNLQRRVSIYANAQGRPSGDVGNDVRKITDNWKLPPGYRFNVGGQQEEMADSMASALGALGLAVIFIYFVLASQFGSFLQPLAIMMSLPLSLVGVFLALLVTGSTLNLFSIIGFIMLMGLVTKNAILLVDFTNQGLREGKSLQQAILDAGQVRLRPILMTTLAMIFGMLPMAMGMGSSGSIQAPMGRAVIGGVITSSLLTLLVVPVTYTYLYGLGQRFSRWMGSDAANAERKNSIAGGAAPAAGLNYPHQGE